MRKFVEGAFAPCGEGIEDVERIVEILGGLVDAFSPRSNEDFMEHVVARPGNFKVARACDSVVFEREGPRLFKKNVDMLKGLGVNGSNYFNGAFCSPCFCDEFDFRLLVAVEILDVLDDRGNVEGGEIVVEPCAEDGLV